MTHKWSIDPYDGTANCTTCKALIVRRGDHRVRMPCPGPRKHSETCSCQECMEFTQWHPSEVELADDDA